MHYLLTLLATIMALTFNSIEPKPIKINKILLGKIGGKILNGIKFSEKDDPEIVTRSNNKTKLEASALVNKVNTHIKASSGGYSGSVHDGKLGASGVAKASIDMKLHKGRRINVKVQLPSGKAHAGPVGASVDLSAKVEGGLSKDKKDFTAGIEGPKAAVKLGPVKVSLDTGLGVKVYTNEKKKVGGEVSTPVGSFGGVKTGCSLRVCVFACVVVKVC